MMLNTKDLPFCRSMRQHMKYNLKYHPQLHEFYFKTAWNWKMADALFRISSMTNSFKYKPRCVLTLQFSTGPSKLLKLWVVHHPFILGAGQDCLEVLPSIWGPLSMRPSLAFTNGSEKNTKKKEGKKKRGKKSSITLSLLDIKFCLSQHLRSTSQPASSRDSHCCSASRAQPLLWLLIWWLWADPKTLAEAPGSQVHESRKARKTGTDRWVLWWG